MKSKSAPLKIRNVQALRALAAMMVVGVHLPLHEQRIFGDGALLGWANSAGAIGVDLFFVISGFIMVTTTWEAFGREGAASAFLMRRILRIYPFYLVTFSLQLMLAGAAPWALHWAPQTPWQLFASFTLIPHGQDPAMVVAWSLQFEVYFYLCFALALRYARTNLPAVIALWGALTLACAALSVAFPNVPLRFIGSPLTFEFLMGVAVGALAISGRLAAPRTLFALGCIGLIVAAALSTRYPDGFPTLNDTFFRAFVCAPPMALLVYAAVGLEERMRLVAPRPFVALGDASYSLYLWHGIAIGLFANLVARLHPHGKVADAVFDLAGFAVAAFAALVIYGQVELRLIRAFRHLGRAAPDRAIAGEPAGA
jgi:peptidoglycan/LPS O-acetylase OafA/YrhL